MEGLLGVDSSSRISGKMDKNWLAEKTLYHGSLVPSFSLTHTILPTSDSKFPGGPAWFAIDDETLSLWRAGQTAADSPELLDSAEAIYLHRFKVKPDRLIMDFSDVDSVEFYAKIHDSALKARGINPEEDETEFSGRLIRELSERFFDEYSYYDGYIVKDNVSGQSELVIKNPAESLEPVGINPESFYFDREYSCFSCQPKRFLLYGNKKSFALIPDSQCAPGYHIKQLR